MASRVELRFATLLLGGALGTLILGVVGFGWLTYRDMNATILRGFDEKLKAVSTSSAVFVDGDLHEELGRPRTLTGIAVDPSTETIWGLDATLGMLVRVDAEGWTEPLSRLPAPHLSGLVWQAPGRLHAASRLTGRLWTLDLQSETWTEGVRLHPGIRDLAMAPGDSILLAAGPEGLRAYRMDSGAPIAQASDLSVPFLSGVAVLPDGKVVAVSLDEGLIFRKERLTGPLTHEAQRLSPVWVEGDGGSRITGGLAFHPRSGQLVGAGDRLWYVDAESGAATSPASLPGYRGGDEPAYQHYRRTMARIMERKDVTYLYSQQLVSAEGDIVYVLDGTQGEDYSPPGTTDFLPREEASGAAAVLRSGAVHLSGIQAWDAWGLLKSAFAPIYGADGEPVAMIGADVNISIISTKARGALARVGALGLVALLLGAFASHRMARWLVVPLQEVRDGALRMAAGDFRHRIRPQPVAELNELGVTINRMGEALETRRALERREGETLRTLHLDRQVDLALRTGGEAGSVRLQWPDDVAAVPGEGWTPEDRALLGALLQALQDQSGDGPPAPEVTGRWVDAFVSGSPGLPALPQPLVVEWADGTRERLDTLGQGGTDG